MTTKLLKTPARRPGRWARLLQTVRFFVSSRFRPNLPVLIYPARRSRKRGVSFSKEWVPQTASPTSKYAQDGHDGLYRKDDLGGHVKPFVKSQKKNRDDAEAIVEAASRPTMRYVE